MHLIKRVLSIDRSVNGDSILEGCGVRMETKTRIVGGQTSFPGVNQNQLFSYFPSKWHDKII